MDKKYKIISLDLQKSLVDFLDEIQFDAATEGTDAESMQKINFCSWAINELLNSYNVMAAADLKKGDIYKMKKKPKILIVRSMYNETLKLYESASEELDKKKIYWGREFVNGAFEIPVVIARNIKKFDVFIAIGIIIKGKTHNFELISQAITNGLIQLSIEHKKPIGNAIITCLNKGQAEKRADKGKEAAKAVLEVLECTS